ncbi:hypothetical protein [Emticicia sp. W12TSBA100-4]|uniref:hypothetical protein n=1 Tax=Emticicia sp. W12TSBA100-4 TaxID=3160965 RepID=UPI003305698C
MKKTVLSFLLLVCSFSGFSQSFSVDSKSLSVPRYANQAAINTANPSPTAGRLVYDNSLNQYAYYNGSAWTNFPTSSSASTNYWVLNQTTGRVELMAGLPNGIEANRFTSNGVTSATAPLINSIGNANTFLRYGQPQGNHAIMQESTTGNNLSGSSINWRYYDNANPQGITHLFGYSANTFNVTGGLTTTGNATINGTSTVTQASALRGKTTIGTTATAGNGLEIQSSTTNAASPDIYIKSPNNIIRYGGTTGNAGMMQSVINSATPASASMSFVHLDNAATPTQTTMMTLDGEGDMTVSGFTKLGGFGADVPAIKTKYYTGTMTTANGGWPAASYDIAHGLTFSKIISMSVLVSGLSNITVGENSSLGGYQYIAYFDTSNIKLVRGASSASITPAAGLNVTFKVLVTYIP